MARLETPRLSLRPPLAADAQAFMDIFRDPEVVANKQVTLTEATRDLGLARRKTTALSAHWGRAATAHIISLITAGDLRSMRVAAKAGEQFERTGVDPINAEPVHVYGIHRRDPCLTN